MKNRAVPAVLILVFCAALSCSQDNTREAGLAASHMEADVRAVRKALDQWTQLYNAGRYEDLIFSFYAEDAVLMAPKGLICKGREAILQGYMQTAEVNNEHVDKTVVEDVRVSGDLAVASGWDIGTSTPRAGGSPAKYNVKWLMVMKRQPDGAWKFIYEVWNENDSSSGTL